MPYGIYMDNVTISTADNKGTLINKSAGIKLVYSAETDARVIGAGDGKIDALTLQDALDLAAEIRAWGFYAEANYYAVLVA
jgi:hypothetical protein